MKKTYCEQTSETHFAIYLNSKELSALTCLLSSDPTDSCISIMQAIKAEFPIGTYYPPINSREIVFCHKCNGSGKILQQMDMDNFNSSVVCTKCDGDGTEIQIISVRRVPITQLWKNYFAK